MILMLAEFDVCSTGDWTTTDAVKRLSDMREKPGSLRNRLSLETDCNEGSSKIDHWYVSATDPVEFPHILTDASANSTKGSALFNATTAVALGIITFGKTPSLTLTVAFSDALKPMKFVTFNRKTYELPGVSILAGT